MHPTRRHVPPSFGSASVSYTHLTLPTPLPRAFGTTAIELYERYGFQRVAEDDDSVTMLAQLAPRPTV